MDQHETWHGGRPRPWPHCVRWGPSSLAPMGHSPQFLAHVCCGQTAWWTKMPFDREVGLSTGHIVLDGDPAPLTQRGTVPQFSVHVYCGQMVAHLSYCWAHITIIRLTHSATMALLQCVFLMWTKPWNNLFMLRNYVITVHQSVVQCTMQPTVQSQSVDVTTILLHRQSPGALQLVLHQQPV